MSDLVIDVGSEWLHRTSGSHCVFFVVTASSTQVVYRVIGGYGQSTMLRVDFLSTFKPRPSDTPAQESIAIDDTFNDDTPAQTFSDMPAQGLGSMLGGRYFESNVKYNTYGKQAPQVVGNEMRLIGIAGQARAGKDTLASHLLANLDDWSRASFADPLKSMLTAIGVDCSDDAKAAIDDCFGVTPRHMMQTLGTEWGRHLIDNDIWVKAFAHLNAGKCVIVPDVRFENEANLVREHGILIHLVGRGGIGGAHVSENPIDFKEGDIVIDNSRDLDWLQAQVDGNSVLSGFIDGVDE